MTLAVSFAVVLALLDGEPQMDHQVGSPSKHDPVNSQIAKRNDGVSKNRGVWIVHELLYCTIVT